MWVLEGEGYINSSLRENDTCLCSSANKLGSLDIWYHLYSNFPDLSLQEDIGTHCNISQKHGIIYLFLVFCFSLNYWFSSHTAPAMVSLTWSDIWLICISVLSVCADALCHCNPEGDPCTRGWYRFFHDLWSSAVGRCMVHINGIVSGKGRRDLLFLPCGKCRPQKSVNGNPKPLSECIRGPDCLV